MNKIDEALEAIQKAHDVVSDMCNGSRQWKMSIPADPDRDSDLIIGEALRLSRTALEQQRVPNGWKIVWQDALPNYRPVLVPDRPTQENEK